MADESSRGPRAGPCNTRCDHCLEDAACVPSGIILFLGDLVSCYCVHFPRMAPSFKETSEWKYLPFTKAHVHFQAIFHDCFTLENRLSPFLRVLTTPWSFIKIVIKYVGYHFSNLQVPSFAIYLLFIYCEPGAVLGPELNGPRPCSHEA